MVLLDGSVVLVALPAIQSHMRTPLQSLQWTVDAYTLPFAALMLTAGTIGDRMGRKQVFLLGLVLFLIGSTICALATSFSPLLIGRIVQGMGAAAIAPGSLSLLAATFKDPAERAHAIGIWTAISGVSLAAGPLVGGLIIQAFDWQAIFFMNLPIGAIALILGVPLLLNSRNPSARRIDLPGQVLVTGGLTCLIMALIESSRWGWASASIVGLFVGAAVLLGAFLVVELRVREPLLPMELFRNPVFSVACLAALLMGFVTIGAMFFMTQYFQDVQSASAFGAGLRLLPLTVGVFIVSPFAGRITGRVGPRAPIVVGALLIAAGFGSVMTLTPTTSYTMIWWQLGLVGIGIGCMFAPLTVAVMAATPPNRAGLGSSMINTFRTAGITTGTAVLGTIVLRQFSDNIAANLVQRHIPAAQSASIAHTIAQAGADASRQPGSGGLPLSHADLTQTINVAFVDAVKDAFLISAVCMVVTGVLAGLLMGRFKKGAPQPEPITEARATANPA